MLPQLIKRKFYLNKHLDAPLLEQREEYLNYWADKGASMRTLKDTAGYLLRIVQFLHLENDGIITLKVIEEAGKAWGEFQYNHPQKQWFSECSKNKFVKFSIAWLKRLNRLEALPEDQESILNQLFERRHALKRLYSAPLLKERLLYLQLLTDLKAKRNTLRKVALYQVIVIDYLRFFTIRSVKLPEIENAALKWAANKKVCLKETPFSKFSKNRFINVAVNWFKALGCFEEEKKPPILFQSCLDQYLQYMIVERGLSKETLPSRLSVLRDFLSNLSQRLQFFASIAPAVIDEILIKRYEDVGLSRRSIQSNASIVRSFMRYAESQQWCSKGVAESIRAPRVYRHEAIPSSLHWHDVKKVLASCYSDHPTHIRDYAIMLLLSVYGMRRIEVAKLRIQDIDWKREQFYLRRAKRSKPQIFPLSKPVGEALSRYINEVRPRHCSTIEEIFVSCRMPYKALGATAITGIVHKHLKPFNFPIKHHGPHALRHSCATHLINSGFSLKEISDHLGHKKLESSRIYAKVDLTNLRKVAEQNWEGLL